MADVVTTSEASKGSSVVRVALAEMSSHGVGHSKDVRSTRSKEREPEPEIGSELGVVPGVAT